MLGVGIPLPPDSGVAREKSARVLVVEDEQSVAESLGFLLRLDGFAVEWATTGPLALRLFDQFSPDLVLLDLMLPGLDGLDVCRELRRRAAVPIIMVTARDTEQDRQRGLRAGAVAYVTKPYALRELRELIHDVLSRPSEPPVVDLRDDHPVELAPPRASGPAARPRPMALTLRRAADRLRRRRR